MKPFICQSCGFPFSAEIGGTNRDGSKNMDYCINCFKDGLFTDPHLTEHELEHRLMRMAHEHNEMSLEEAREIIRILPSLKRWKMTNIF